MAYNSLHTSVTDYRVTRNLIGYTGAVYINDSLHLARKYAQIFVRGHYLFREAKRFPRAKLEENCELRGADNVQGQISEHIFKAKWRLLWLLSFKYFSQHVETSLSI